MILQSLQQYYQRLAAEKVEGLPEFGFSSEKIGWVAEINNDGVLQDVYPLDTSDKRKTPRIMSVPKLREGKRTSGLAANFLWDKTDYVFGFGVDKNKNIIVAQEYFDDFKRNHLETANGSDDEGLVAITKFLLSWSPNRYKELKYHEEMAGQNVVFKLSGENRFIHERPAVRELIKKKLEEPDEEAVEAQCLVSGEKTAVARLHNAIKGMIKPKSIKSMKAEFTLVGFNLDSFTSYGKGQNYNAPVGKRAAFEYVTALNYLLRFESRQKMLIGDTTVVFWAEKPHAMEESLFYFFNPPEEKAKDEEGIQMTLDFDTTQRVRTFLDCVREGRFNDPAISGDSRFYILGLAPNASRLAVRFWLQSSVSELAEKLHRYFREMEIETQYKDEQKYPALWQLLCETAPGPKEKKSENVSPLLGGAVMRSILTGEHFPESLLAACINRIRAEQDNSDKHQYKINYRRMSLIKACLVRNHSKEVLVSLDKTKKDVPYLLGRLFAIFEKAQEDAAGGKLNATIKDRYFASAMATPRSVFPILFRLNNYHVSKGEHGGYYSKLIAEVVDMLDPDSTPAHLPLEEQGMFAIGYYHQRNDLFRKHESISSIA